MPKAHCHGWSQLGLGSESQTSPMVSEPGGRKVLQSPAPGCVRAHAHTHTHTPLSHTHTPLSHTHIHTPITYTHTHHYLTHTHPYLTHTHTALSHTHPYHTHTHTHPYLTHTHTHTHTPSVGAFTAGNSPAHWGLNFFSLRSLHGKLQLQTLPIDNLDSNCPSRNRLDIPEHGCNLEGGDVF